MFPQSVVETFGSIVHLKKIQSLWIYMTVIVENMQTVCEGLHVNCKIANVNDFDNLTIVCSVMTLC